MFKKKSVRMGILAGVFLLLLVLTKTTVLYYAVNALVIPATTQAITTGVFGFLESLIALYCINVAFYLSPAYSNFIKGYVDKVLIKIPQKDDLSEDDQNQLETMATDVLVIVSGLLTLLEIFVISFIIY